MEELRALWESFVSLLGEHLKREPSGVSPLGFLALLAAAALLALWPPLWRVTSYFVTVVHEAGHALAALSVFSRLRGIKVRWDRSGETQSSGSSFLPFRVWTTWWGYPAPAGLGFFYLWTVREGWQGAALSATLLLMGVLVLNIRSPMAFLSIGASAVGVWAAWWLLPFTLVAPLLALVGFFLLLGGVRGVVNLTRHHLRGSLEHSDAKHLQEATWVVPSVVWLATFWAATLAACLGGLWAAFGSLFQQL